MNKDEAYWEVYEVLQRYVDKKITPALLQEIRDELVRTMKAVLLRRGISIIPAEVEAQIVIDVANLVEQTLKDR
jgi:hypothetical protein